MNGPHAQATLSEPLSKLGVNVATSEVDDPSDAAGDATGGNSGSKEVGKEGEVGRRSRIGKFGYLLSMPLWSATLERRATLHQQELNVRAALQALQSKTADDVWLSELAVLRAAVSAFLQQQQEDAN